MTLIRQNDDFEIAEINRRLTVLLLADKLGSVTEACRQLEFSKTQFYVYKKRYESEGIQGLKLHYQAVNHPNATPVEVQNLIREWSIQNPDFGSQHLSMLLKNQGIHASAATVHKILLEQNLASRKSRWIFLESLHHQKGDLMNPSHLEFLQKMNPCHEEKKHRGSSPGLCLVQDCVLIFKDAHIKIYLHFIIDTFSNFVIGRIDYPLAPLSAMLLLKQEALPFYRNFHVIPSTIYTHNGRTFAGNKRHDYELKLNKHSIRHIITENGQSHGFAKQFKQIVKNELKINKSMKPALENPSFQLFMREWIHFYNTQRASIGFPNYSKLPLEVHESGLSERSLDTLNQ